MGAIGTTARWRATRDRLAARPLAELSPAELDLLADAEFWTDDPHRSVEVRQAAYRAHVADGDDAAAAQSARQLFFEFFLVGELSPASGWLERCRQHTLRSDDPAVHGWLAFADSYPASAAGEHDAAAAHARAAHRHALAADDADLAAMAVHAEGCALVAQGRRQDGLRRLDEAMVSVINGELQPLHVGWIFCNVVSTCFAIADLRRATEWSAAAMRWCETLREGHMYPGLCRVYACELSLLHGDWDGARRAASQACDDLVRFDPRYAGQAYLLAGDLHRLRGDLASAEAAYRRAHELGADPQPGLSLVALARDDAATALRSIRSALRPGPTQPLPRAQLLLALASVATACDDRDALTVAETGLRSLANETPGPLIAGLADLVAGMARLADNQPAEAIGPLRAAVTALTGAGFPYEAATARCVLADALLTLADRATARLELDAAEATFDQLGAVDDVRRARARRGRLDDTAHASHDTGPLSPREAEVLSLVASGATNREIAATLTISVHTVARHMTNIRTKLGVPSRAAAAATAIDHGWLQTE